MDLHLGGHDVGADRPRSARIARFFDHSGRRFVAGGFDAEDQHWWSSLSGYFVI
jgi:hypothetical protein